MFRGQRDLFIKKLNADFEVMQKLIERKRSELQDKIFSAYDAHIIKTHNFSEGLSALQETIDQIKVAEIRVDLDQINLNKAISYRVKEIQTEMDIDIQGNELDLLNSRFINDPFIGMEKHLNRFNFFPV